MNVPLKLLVSPQYLKGMKLGDNVTVEAGPDDASTDHGISYPVLIQQYYAKALAVAIPRIDLPDDTSGFTNLLEAMAMGKPVIMTRTGCLDLDIEKEGIGFYVKPYDVNGWIEALGYARSNGAKMSEMGARGRKLAESYYNTERFGRDIVTYFGQFVHGC
jgi:glycosyltransferase involved in cell wall biosynthesis